MLEDRPDWIYLQGWGAMNPTALKEANKINFPMNRLVGVWWAGGEDDVRPAGELAKGYSSLNFSGVGQNFSAILDILKYVVDRGKSQVTSKDKIGENLYNRGVMNAVLIAEGIRAAQQLTGKKHVGAKMCAAARKHLTSPTHAGRSWGSLACRSDPFPRGRCCRRTGRGRWARVCINTQCGNGRSETRRRSVMAQRPAPGDALGGLVGAVLNLKRWGFAGKRHRRIEELAAVPQRRDAELLQVLSRQVRQDRLGRRAVISKASPGGRSARGTASDSSTLAAKADRGKGNRATAARTGVADGARKGKRLSLPLAGANVGVLRCATTAFTTSRHDPRKLATS